MAPPNVKGWEGGAAWITTATLLDRYNFCGAMLKAGQPNGRVVSSGEAVAVGLQGDGRSMPARSHAP